MALVAGLALVSCNENFDEDMPAINYPEKPSLGIWENDLVGENDVKYTVNLTLNEKGDTICDVTTFDPVSKRTNVFSNGKTTYDKRVGMIVVDYEDSPLDGPARVAINYTNDLQGRIINIYRNIVGSFTSAASFVPAEAKSVSVYGDWELADGTKVNFSSENGKATVNGAEGTYNYAGTEGTVTAGSKTYKFNLNDKGQMFFTENGGQAQYAKHVMTPLPDDWVEYAVGVYQSWLFDAQPDIIMEYSEYRSKGRITGLYVTNKTKTFLWKKGSSTVTLLDESYETGYGMNDGAGNQHQIIGYPNPLSNTDSRTAMYSNSGYGIFSFGMMYGDKNVGFIGPANQDDPMVDKYIIKEVFE